MSYYGPEDFCTLCHRRTEKCNCAFLYYGIGPDMDRPCKKKKKKK